MSSLFQLANEGKLESRYTGTFSRGNRSGHGLLEDFVRGKIIEGEFNENFPWGRVIIRWTKDNTAEHLRSFDGEFVKGEMHGKGTLIMRNGEIFRGIFKNNKRSQGILTDGDGVSHQRLAKYDDENGMLISFEDVENGAKGVFSSCDDDYKNANNNKNDQESAGSPKAQNVKSVDALHARIEFPNGDYFIGETLLGRAHGQGKLYFVAVNEEKNDENISVLDGGFYEGDFEDGKFHGFGKLMRTQYSRKFSSSCGTGEKISPEDQSVLFSCWRYEGKFSQGLFHGFGRYWDFDGGFYEGSFVHGEMNGVGKFVYHHLQQENTTNDDVVRYEGEFFKNRPHGAGAKWYVDRVIRGYFENGKCCTHENTSGLATASIEYFGKLVTTTTTTTKNQRNGEQEEDLTRAIQNVDNQLQALSEQGNNNNNNDNGDDVKKISEDGNDEQQQITANSSSFETDEVVATYVGGIFEDKRHGTGEMRYENGDVYFGEFEHDNRHGVGILTSGNATNVYEGKFVNDQPQGPCSVKNLETNTLLVGSAVAGSGSSSRHHLTGIISDANGFEKQILVAP